MDLRMLDNDDILDKNINMTFAVKRGLIIDGNCDNYRKVQALYRKGLDYYINSKINLVKYDDAIENSNLNFVAIDKKERNIFHETSYLNLKYIYVRNFLYVEKLSFDCLKRLISRVNKENYDIDEELIYIVSSTFHDVVIDNYRRGEYFSEAKSCYGSVIPSNIVPSDYLVIVIAYDDNDSSISDEEYLLNIDKREQFIGEISKKIESEVSFKLEINTKVLIRLFVDE